jgi:hypothetical protein
MANKPNFNIFFGFHCKAQSSTNSIQKVSKHKKQRILILFRYPRCWKGWPTWLSLWMHEHTSSHWLVAERQSFGYLDVLSDFRGVSLKLFLCLHSPSWSSHPWLYPWLLGHLPPQYSAQHCYLIFRSRGLYYQYVG